MDSRIPGVSLKSPPVTFDALYAGFVVGVLVGICLGYWFRGYLDKKMQSP